MSDEIIDLTAVDLADRISRRDLSPVEIMEALAGRIESLEPMINAFAWLDLDLAREGAAKAERRVLHGDSGSLTGIPVTVKDLTATYDLPTQSGSRAYRGHRPKEDAPVVDRLRRAGAVLVGKTSTPELGWCALSHSPLTGVTHNPHRHGYTAGGSSCGAAAAAAAGFGPLHQGSDAAGSIRLPASFCGVVGVKPSYGRVPQFPVSVGDYTSHAGPLARTVGDCALMLDVMCGPDARDHTSLDRPAQSFVTALREPFARDGLCSLAYSRTLGHARVDAEVASIADAAAARLAEAAGMTLREVEPSWGNRGPELGRFFWAAHLTSVLGMLDEWRESMDPDLVACIEEGATYSLATYQGYRARKYAYCSEVNQTLEQHQYLLTPTASVAAFPVGLLRPANWPQQLDHPWDWMDWAQFSYPFNFVGAPAVTVPCGMTSEGLPVGLQIVGRRFSDAGVLRLAALLESLGLYDPTPSGLPIGSRPPTTGT